MNESARMRLAKRRSIVLYSIVLLLFAVVFNHNLAYSQSNWATLKGVVVDRSDGKTPIEFASLAVLPQGLYATTNNKGEYSLNRVSPGRINIRVEFLGMESIDTTLSIAPGSDVVLNFKLRESNFRLDDVVVVAQESKAGRSTASTISRQAMDHLQTSSLSDVMQLLPGGVTQNPDLSIAKVFSIRSGGGAASGMNALGTAIIVDGAPLSNNANLQTLSPAISGGGVAVGGGSSPASGLDIRSISTDNIESIEVIRGIASVEHGDLTSGAVIVRSKAGREPLTVRFKTDPRIYQTSVSRGVSLGEKRGNLNISGDYAYSTSNLTTSYAYYQRATGKLLYSNLFGKLSSNTSLDFTFGKDTREMNPDDQRSQLATGAKEIGVQLNTNGTWNINRGWLTNIKYVLSGSYRDKHSFREELLGNAFAAYSMSETDGAVLSNKPGQKVYDILGNELTNIPQSEMGYYATYLPNEYFSRYDIYGKEVNVFANVNATLSKRVGNVTNRILLGANLKSDGNLGDGKIYDLANPPSRVLSAENSSPRPRKYSSIPFITQLSLYGEENLTWEIGEREVIFQGGVRYDNINGKSAFTPRTNLSIEVVPNHFWLRGGFGLHAKAPTSLYLYPEAAYFDLVHYNTLGSELIPEAEQLLLGTTKKYDTTNKDLQIAVNQKSEVGFDLRFSGMRFSLTAFEEIIRNGYNLGRQIENFIHYNYIQYEVAQHNPGAIPTLQERGRDNIFFFYSSPQNNVRAHTRGIEFDFDFGRIDRIRTSFVLNGAYLRGSEWLNQYAYSSRKDGNKLERHIGVYEPGMVKEQSERFVTTLRAIHNIPSIGFVLTATAQVNWINNSWAKYGNDTTFVGFISHEDGVFYTFAPWMNEDPSYNYMHETRSPTRFIRENYFPVFLFNFHLTKEIGENVKASFYANNFINNRPLYESKRSPGSFSRLNIPLYFGFELLLRIK